MKKCIIVLATVILSGSSLLQAAADLSPTFSIRYEDFINSPVPGAAVGLKLTIDDERYTGFEVNSDGSDSRLLIGWKWGLFGVGSKTDENDNVFPHYTFGVSYSILQNLVSNFEYVMTPDSDEFEDKLRLTLSVGF